MKYLAVTQHTGSYYIYLVKADYPGIVEDILRGQGHMITREEIVKVSALNWVDEWEEDVEYVCAVAAPTSE